MRTNRIWSTVALALWLLAVAGSAAAHDANQIIDVSPNSADRGTTGLTVTFTLDSDTPPPPPAGILPDSVSIGAMEGASISHDGQYVVTAVFDIPAGESLGAKDCEVIFTVPPSTTLAFSLTGGFTVTASDAPPTISEDPRSQWFRSGDPVTLSVEATGTEPMDYEWYRDDALLPGGSGQSYAIAEATIEDAGDYHCIVSNVFGSDTSESATLTLDRSVPVVEAPYPVIDTMQALCYDDASWIAFPETGEPYHGQDAQHDGYLATYALSADGLTVDDLVTGLTWTQTPDTDGDGDIDADDKVTWATVQNHVDALNGAVTGGYDDWRLPSIKELYSLMDFRGEDPSGYQGTDTSGLAPFLDTAYFDFGYGDQAAGERIIDAQFASTTLYVSTVMGGRQAMFGLNLADGRIKGYPTDDNGMGAKEFYVLCVRGNAGYGANDLVDNGDGTVTDRATGLMWEQPDSGVAMTWEAALEYAETKNASAYLGYSDWRLPSASELQSIIDYTRSPDTTSSAAIDPVFSTTPYTNGSCVFDFDWYWTSTTHADSQGHGTYAAYICFGRALGYMENQWMDVHGAGAQRSDPKDGNMSGFTALDCGYYHDTAPQGDEVRPGHTVRLVRGGNGPLRGDFGFAPEDPTTVDSITFTAMASGGTSPYGLSWDIAGTAAEGVSVQQALPIGTHTVVLTITDAAGLESTVTRQITVAYPRPPGVVPVENDREETDPVLLFKDAEDPGGIDLTFDAATAFIPNSANRI